MHQVRNMLNEDNNATLGTEIINHPSETFAARMSFLISHLALSRSLRGLLGYFYNASSAAWTTRAPAIIRVR